MLILKRKPGESFTVGEDVRVYVLDIKGRHVRIGVEAPPGVGVYREELLGPIQPSELDSPPPAEPAQSP